MLGVICNDNEKRNLSIKTKIFYSFFKDINECINSKDRDKKTHLGSKFNIVKGKTDY